MKKAKTMKKANGFSSFGIAAALALGLSAACIPGAMAHSVERAASASSLGADEAAVYEKTEVVYATLSAAGALEDVYVVNQFDVETAGEVLDYGPYADVSNLTDQGVIGFDGEAASFDVPEGVFYYQGNVEASSAELPWKVDVDYFLDGAAVSAEELAGRSGELRVHVGTESAEGVDPAFAASYMLQINFTLDGDTTSGIEADGATVASSGRNRTVAFTVLPGRDADCTLVAQVSDFEMSGIQVAALPYSLAMEMPDTSGMTDQMQELSDAVGSLDAGAASLSEGIGSLSAGADALAAGSDEFAAGLANLSASADGLAEASGKINEALGNVDFSKLNDLVGLAQQYGFSVDPDALSALAALSQLSQQYDGFNAGLGEFASGIEQLAAGYAPLNSGTSDLAAGLSQLDAGAQELASGTAQLNSATIEIPSTMRAEIEALMADYDFPEFEAVSFMDLRNKSTQAVQFVLTTAPIELPEPEAVDEPEEEEATVLDRLLALFR